MNSKQLYSSLNVFYLKMFQYEKYLGHQKADEIFNHIEEELEWLKTSYEHRFHFSKMSLKEMLEYCVIDLDFQHSLSEKKIKTQLMYDIYEVEEIRRKMLRNQ